MTLFGSRRDPGPSGSTPPDPLAMRPRLREGLRFEIRQEDGSAMVIIEDVARNKFFQVGPHEFTLISEFDGSRDLRQALQSHWSAYGNSQIKEADALQITQWLAANNLLAGQGPAQTDRLRQTAAKQAFWKSLSRWNLISLRIRLLHPEPLLERCGGLAHALFSKAGFAVWLVLVVCGAYCIGDRWGQIFGQTEMIFSGYRWLWMLLLWGVLKVIHESGHALACKRYGVPVSEAGLVLILFAPLAYVDVTASWRLPDRIQRMIIAAAGIYMELAVAAMAAVVWMFFPTGAVADFCQQTILLASLTTLIFNANPLMRFDGYYLLSDALGIVNLYGKGSAWLNERWYWCWGLPATLSGTQGWRGWAIGIYGFASFVWRILLTISLLLVASVMFDGAGLIMAVIAGFFWLALPLQRQVKEFRARLARKSTGARDWRRPAVSAVLIAAACVWFFVLPAPHWVPAVVDFEGESVVRARYDGFVREIFVADGQDVVAGELLISLENPQLNVELACLASEIESARVSIRMLQGQGDIAGSQVESERLAGLQQQYAEKCAWAEANTIRAPIDGRVVARNLSEKVNTFCKQGDALLSVVHPGRLQVIASLDQVQADSLRANGDQIYWLLLTGFRRVPMTLNQVDPKASDALPHLALGAHVGGALAVRQTRKPAEDSQTETLRLVAPRFAAKLSTIHDEPQFAAAGERGSLRLATANYPRACQWLLQIRNWLDMKLGSRRYANSAVSN